MSNLVRMEIFAEHFEEKGDYEMAEMIVGRIVSAVEIHEGPLSANLVEHLYNLASLQEALGRRGDSIRCARRAQRIAQMHAFHAEPSSLEIQEFLDRV